MEGRLQGKVTIMSGRHDVRVFVGSAGALPLFAAPEAPTDNNTPLTPEPVYREPVFRSLDPTRGAGEAHVTAGRPYHVEGEPRAAPLRVSAAWAGGAEPLVVGLDMSTRRALGEAWLAAASEEHASVACFARLTLSLLALGAPADLVARSEQAAEAEVDHARLCFGLASAYLGSPVSPGPLPVFTVAAPTLVALARTSWRDGCLGEGGAAAIARAARRRAHDPAVCAVLSLIARDKGAHAELAWDVIEYCLDRGGRDVEAVLREELACASRAAGDPPPGEAQSGALAALLAEHGQLSHADRARCVAEAARTAARRAGWLLAPGGTPRG